MSTTLEPRIACPAPIRTHETIQLAHGGGGTLMHELIDDVFLSAFQPADAAQPHDAAVFPCGSARLAFTTDSFVVHPLIFPGGDIGSLAVHGTVNDLAMSGARPLYLSAGFVLEEGLPTDTLRTVVASMQQAAKAAGVSIVTGDTKVVDRGKGDGIYINTAGIGVIEHCVDIRPSRVQPGDAVIVSGDIGRHGIAIMAVREGLAFETEIKSDSASVAETVQSLVRAGIEIHCLRDLTRGGLSSALNEIASAAGVHVRLQESSIPVQPDVQCACEMLGFDPLYVACEGRFVAFVPEIAVDDVVQIMQQHPVSGGVAKIGTVERADAGLVTMTTAIGTSRIVDMLSGEQLPRIC